MCLIIYIFFFDSYINEISDCTCALFLETTSRSSVFDLVNATCGVTHRFDLLIRTALFTTVRHILSSLTSGRFVKKLLDRYWESCDSRTGTEGSRVAWTSGVSQRRDGLWSHRRHACASMGTSDSRRCSDNFYIAPPLRVKMRLKILPIKISKQC